MATLRRWSRCSRTCRARVPDLIVVGGDVVEGPLPVETLELLDAVEVALVWVRGNCDRDPSEWVRERVGEGTGCLARRVTHDRHDRRRRPGRGVLLPRVAAQR